VSYVKRIVCLANSYKTGGRCIAGREVLGNGKYGDWIRPVSARASGELSILEIAYRDHTVPKLLDVIDVPLLRPCPNGHQTENHEIVPHGRWSKAGEVPWQELESLREFPESLWIGNECEDRGACNWVSESEAAAFHHSLVLIQKRDFKVRVRTHDRDGAAVKACRGTFKYDATYYSLKVTDPPVIERYAPMEDGVYKLHDVYLCISLARAWEEDGCCHKLVAAVFTNPPL
jgi:hypothetical protein